MSDEKPPLPPQPTTTQLPVVPTWAIELTRSVKDGFAGVEQRLDTMETNLEIQGGSVVDLGKRMTNLEERVGKSEGRQGTNSIKVRSITESDLAQDAELSKERAAREELAVRVEGIETKVGAIHSAVVGVIRNPKVLFVGKVIFAAAVAYSGLHGLKVLP